MVENLDLLAAKMAQKIVKEDSGAKELDNLVTKTLGVLQENGVYACLLFLFSRSDREEVRARGIRNALLETLNHAPLKTLQLSLPGDSKTWTWEFVSKQLLEDVKLFDDLDALFLVKELYEQTLIYARYGAKAAKVESKGTR
ncbi:MAG TPA: hypothetical protein ENI60_02965 [Candidatus Fraserbacteria bacterium]|nr:hypothetical protein [Candidatus Fraserbacteria bacterium]